MNKEEIAHLAMLSRIALTDAEKESFATSITDILGYVREIETITGTSAPEKKVGALHSVMRADENPHEGGQYTEVLLAAAPDREGRYVRVKKVLDKSKNMPT